MKKKAQTNKKTKINKASQIIKSDQTSETSASFMSNFGTGWESIRSLATKVSKHSNQIDQIMQALNHFASGTKDKGVMQGIVSALASLDQKTKAAKTKAATKPKTASSSTVSSGKSNEDGFASFYDVLGSGGLNQIVKEVMSKRRNKKR